MEGVFAPIYAEQHFDAGIIVLSYVVSVIGAQTTLELLGRRTSIKGSYNLFLLCGAALAMGSVGIWSMHFIGNNSLKLQYHNMTYQLVYAPGFTFASLIVAIVCMFCSFAFVCSTEEVLLKRVFLSGMIAGAGVVVMHYVGQFAIIFFVLHYSIPYIVGASLIGIGATTTALAIFFKLRAQWENQWYKRLGCSMIMGVAVCGMHYVAMAGTVYEVIDPTASPPVPALTTTALIAIIAAIVVVTCVVLLGIQIWQSKILLRKKTQSLVVIDAIYFDQEGKLLVKDDGTVPMKEIQADTENIQTGDLTVANPLFTALFKISLAWDTKYAVQKAVDDPSHIEFIQGFDRAAGDLASDLKVKQNAIGTLYDGIISSGSSNRRSRMRFTSPFNESSSFDHDQKSVSNLRLYSGKDWQRSSQTPTNTAFDIIPKTYNRGKHLFLVRKLPTTSATDQFTAQGFRFSDPTFIAHRMATKLSVPEDYMLAQLLEMQKYADHGMRMSIDIERPINVAAAAGMWMGLLVLIEGATPSEGFSLLVNKERRFSLPVVEIMGEDVADHRGPLNPSEKAYLSSLQHSTMLDTVIPRSRSSASKDVSASFIESSGNSALYFINAFQQAAKTLANMSTYSHLIASKAMLHSEIIDIPPFVLTAKPCQLILFKACIISPEIAASINSSASDEVKCLPLALYKSIWEATTNESIQSFMKRRDTAMQTMSQRKMYVTKSIQSNYSYKGRTADTDAESLTSLPPPPRTKRSRNLQDRSSSSTKLGNFLAGKTYRENLDVNQDIDMAEYPEMLPILSSSERFQWLQDVIDSMTNPI